MRALLRGKGDEVRRQFRFKSVERRIDIGNIGRRDVQLDQVQFYVGGYNEGSVCGRGGY